jgi:hypothetical protein
MINKKREYYNQVVRPKQLQKKMQEKQQEVIEIPATL